MKDDYLESVKKQFSYYKLLGERTFEQLSDEELMWQYNTESNSIVIIVNHLWGNMLSRWTDFLTADGEKDWRNRDAEFEEDIKTRKEFLEKWAAGWECLFKALETINDTNSDKTVYIRNQGHTITDAINRQLAHYSYHVGQIVYVGRMIKGKDWNSLSIPKGESIDFNVNKFSKDKHKAHFTDEYIKPKEK